MNDSLYSSGFEDSGNKTYLSMEQIHAILLEMYIELKRISDKHGLKVFLTGGSALGAIRHKGFIPWDDDMDVALPREDYEKFVKIAAAELSPHLKVVWISRACHYKLIDTRYRVQLSKNYKKVIDDDKQSFVAIDIQPFDGVPNGIIGNIHCSKVYLFRALYKVCAPERIIYDEEWRKPWELFAIRVLKMFSPFMKDEDFWKKLFLAEMKRYSYEKCSTIADFVGKYKFRDVYPKKWWEPGKIKKFESIEVIVPYDFDKYLTGIYGDYMIIPDEEKRVKHMD